MCGMDKFQLRRELLSKRAMITVQQHRLWDDAITKRLLSHPMIEQADTVLLYASMQGEFDTTQLMRALWQRGVGVALPRCEPGTRHMDFLYVSDTTQLMSGAHGILEPNPSICSVASATEHTLCLLPGLGFDLSGFRIGYGGGYYDRFLQGFCGHKMGAVYHALFMENLPHDEWDIPADIVITEREEIWCNN